jgi:hypothetical protein
MWQEAVVIRSEYYDTPQGTDFGHFAWARLQEAVGDVGLFGYLQL